MSVKTRPLRAPEHYIVRIRGQAVMLDSDLAALYDVPTGRLNEQVRRNQKRFPADFVFQLTPEEARRSRSQNAILKRGKNIKYLPYVFTEHGAVMAANVLKSERAIEMSVAIVRAFVKLRRMALSVEALARKVAALEQKYDSSFRMVFDAIRQLMTPPISSRRRIGFHTD
jgi:hypothetical protein